VELRSLLQEAIYQQRFAHQRTPKNERRAGHGQGRGVSRQEGHQNG
jgi:hypothetical protein